MLSSLKHEFVVGLKQVKNSVLDRLVSKGYFQKRPDKAIERWSGLTFLAMIGLVMLGGSPRRPSRTGPSRVVCVIVMFLHRAPDAPQDEAGSRRARAREGDGGVPRHGREGADEGAAARPLREAAALRGRARRPEALGAGVRGLFEKPPDWFRTSRTGFDSVLLNRSLSRINSNVGSTLMSGPRAAKSSGRLGLERGLERRRGLLLGRRLLGRRLRRRRRRRLVGAARSLPHTLTNRGRATRTTPIADEHVDVRHEVGEREERDADTQRERRPSAASRR